MKDWDFHIGGILEKLFFYTFWYFFTQKNQVSHFLPFYVTKNKLLGCNGPVSKKSDWQAFNLQIHVMQWYKYVIGWFVDKSMNNQQLKGGQDFFYTSNTLKIIFCLLIEGARTSMKKWRSNYQQISQINITCCSHFTTSAVQLGRSLKRRDRLKHP